MKRTPLKRTSSLSRKTRLSPRRSKPRRVSVIRDRAYLDAVKGLGYCSAATLIDAGECLGPIDPDHYGPRGMGQKTSDVLVYPVCRKHHGCRHDLSGPFRGWDRETLRAWCMEQIAKAFLKVNARRAA